MDQDKLLRLYVKLRALRTQLGDRGGDVAETIVREYSGLISELEMLGVNLNDFQIPPDWAHPSMTSFNLLSGSKTYSRTLYVERTLFLTRFDGLLSYFKVAYLTPVAARPEIGFLGGTDGIHREC